MADLIRDFIIKFKRLRRCLTTSISELTYDDYENNSLAYSSTISLFSKLQEIQTTILQLADENPGVLTQDQIDSIRGSLYQIEASMSRIKIKPVTIEHQQSEEEEKNEEEVIEEVEEPCGVSIREPILRKVSTGTMTLNELRESLGLTKSRGEIDSSRERKLQEELMTEISESTTRMRHIGNALNEQIKEGNSILDDVQMAADKNIHSVQTQNKSISSLTSGSWWTIFRDVKYFLYAIFLFFLCIFVVVLLPKAK